MTPRLELLMRKIVLSAIDLTESVEDIDGKLIVDEVKLDILHQDIAALEMMDDEGLLFDG